MKRTTPKVSPFEKGKQAYEAAKAKAEKPWNTKNPYSEFSGKWVEWNRGFNKCWMQKHA